jgi:hypothetical protein
VPNTRPRRAGASRTRSHAGRTSPGLGACSPPSGSPRDSPRPTRRACTNACPDDPCILAVATRSPRTLTAALKPCSLRGAPSPLWKPSSGVAQEPNKASTWGYDIACTLDARRKSGVMAIPREKGPWPPPVPYPHCASGHTSRLLRVRSNVFFLLVSRLPKWDPRRASRSARGTSMLVTNPTSTHRAAGASLSSYCVKVYVFPAVVNPPSQPNLPPFYRSTLWHDRLVNLPMSIPPFSRHRTNFPMSNRAQFPS